MPDDAFLWTHRPPPAPKPRPAEPFWRAGSFADEYVCCIFTSWRAALMDWEKGRESDNVVEDDGGGGRFGGGGGMQFGGFHIGLGGLLLIVVVSLLLGKNPLQILALLSGGDSG